MAKNRTGEILLIGFILWIISYVFRELTTYYEFGERGFFSSIVWVSSVIIRSFIPVLLILFGLAGFADHDYTCLLLIPLSITAIPWFVEKLFRLEEIPEALKLVYTFAMFFISCLIFDYVQTTLHGSHFL